MITNLQELPEIVLEEISSYLLFREQRYLWQTCRCFRFFHHHQTSKSEIVDKARESLSLSSDDAPVIDLTVFDSKDASTWLQWCTYHHRRHSLALNHHPSTSNSTSTTISSLMTATATIARTRTKALETQSSLPSPPPLKTRFDMFYSNLQSINLQHYCTNAFFYHMGDILPNIKSIQCRRSLLVTDLGLQSIANSKSCQRNLEVLDITYCSNVTYGGTLPLREKLTNLKLLRRQPEWLDGKFYTPFAGGRSRRNTEEDEEPPEVHTYYPDGSFSFSRNSQSTGFICEFIVTQHDGNDDLENNEPHFVGNKLQYNNFQAPLGWPEWTKYCYRPGVSLLNLKPNQQPKKEGSSANSNDERYVLVCQALRGLSPPSDRTLMERVQDQVNVGESKYFDKHGNLLGHDEPLDNDEWVGREGVVMISKMKVLPLTTFLPPPQLLDECQITCDSMMNYGHEFLARREAELHTLLNQDIV